MADEPDVRSYQRQVAEIRRIALLLTNEQLKEFVALLERHAEELQRRVRRELNDAGLAAALVLARELARSLARDLASRIVRATRLATQRIADVYVRATFRLLDGSRPDLRLPAMFNELAARAAQAVLSRPDLVLALRRIGVEHAVMTNAVIRGALARGATVDQLAMELRVHVLGAEALPSSLLLDRRRIGYDAIASLGYERTPENLRTVRAHAGRVNMRSQLIARSEIMAGEHETHVQGAAESPVVRAIRWRLSSRHPHRDVCDILATVDLYGLGPGLYDKRRVPPRPHPRDLCILEDVLWESAADWGSDLGEMPERRHDPYELARSFGLPSSEGGLLADALTAAETRTASGARAA